MGDIQGFDLVSLFPFQDLVLDSRIGPALRQLIAVRCRRTSASTGKAQVLEPV